LQIVCVWGSHFDIREVREVTVLEFMCSVQLWSLWLADHGLFWYMGANILEE